MRYSRKEFKENRKKQLNLKLEKYFTSINNELKKTANEFLNHSLK